MDVLRKVCLCQQQPWVSGEGLFLSGVHRRGGGACWKYTDHSPVHCPYPRTPFFCWVVISNVTSLKPALGPFTAWSHVCPPTRAGRGALYSHTTNESYPEPAYPKPWGSYSFRIAYRSFSNAACLEGECTHPSTGHHSSVGRAFSGQQSLAAGVTGQIPMYIHGYVCTCFLQTVSPLWRVHLRILSVF